jgi:hypothetical protein
MGGACGTYGERRGVYRVLVGRPDGKRQLKNVGLYVMIILKCIFKKSGGEA